MSALSVRLRRGVVPVVVVGLVFAGSDGAVADDTVDPVASEPRCAATAETVEEAGAIAAVCDFDVVVAGLTDPWSMTTVRADGLVEWTSGIVAERSQTPEGDWVPIDASFTAPQEGRVGLVAPAVDMTFSDGTVGEPLAVLVKDGHELVYDMPFDLPARLWMPMQGS